MGRSLGGVLDPGCRVSIGRRGDRPAESAEQPRSPAGDVGLRPGRGPRDRSDRNGVTACKPAACLISDSRNASGPARPGRSGRRGTGLPWRADRASRRPRRPSSLRTGGRSGRAFRPRRRPGGPCSTTRIAENAEPISTTANVDRSKPPDSSDVEPERQRRDGDLVGRPEVDRVHLAMGGNRRKVEPARQEDERRTRAQKGADPGAKADRRPSRVPRRRAGPATSARGGLPSERFAADQAEARIPKGRRPGRSAPSASQKPRRADPESSRRSVPGSESVLIDDRAIVQQEQVEAARSRDRCRRRGPRLSSHSRR